MKEWDVRSLAMTGYCNAVRKSGDVWALAVGREEGCQDGAEKRLKCFYFMGWNAPGLK